MTTRTAIEVDGNVLDTFARSYELADIQIIDVPAKRITYVPDTAKHLVETVEKWSDRYSLPIRQLDIVGKEDHGQWIVRANYDLAIGKTSTFELTIHGSNNKRRALHIIGGKRTLVCSNGMTALTEEMATKTRHTLYVTRRLDFAVSGILARARGYAERYAERERNLESIEFPEIAARALNYKLCVIRDAYSAETARKIDKEIIDPTFAEFRQDNALAVSERFTTAFRQLEQERPEAYRRAIMALDAELTRLVQAH
jgi:hypothetical protein